MKNFLQKLNALTLLKLQNKKKNIVYLIVIAVLIGVNLLLSPFAFRLDLSKGRAYTLSNATKKVVRNIDKQASVDFYVSSDLPTRLIPLKRDVVDLLNEYKKEAGSKIQVRAFDPKKDKQALTKAQEAGVPELQFSQVEQDKYAVTASYFGIVLSQGDKKEVLPQVTELGSLEYNITAALYKITRKDSPKIAIVGYDEPVDPRTDQLATVRKVLGQQFTIDSIKVASDGSQIDPNYKTLLVFDDQKTEYGEGERNALKQYIEKGGKAVFFADGVWVQESLVTTPATNGLTPLFESMGIKLQKNLILSSSSELVNFGNELVSYLVPYPLWIKANQFDPKTSYFSNVNQLTFPWSSSIKVEKKDEYTPRELVKTTNKSWEQTSNFTVSPQAIPKPKNADLKQFAVATDAKHTSGGEAMVIGSSRFVLERYLSRTSDNLGFILNVVNDFASGGALTGIRQRVVSFYPLPDIGENQKDIFKYMNILLLPILLAVYGGVRLMKRR